MIRFEDLLEKVRAYAPEADVDPIADGIGEAVVELHVEFDLRMQLGELIHDGSGAVGGSVVDYQDLGMPIPVVNTAQDLC